MPMPTRHMYLKSDTGYISFNDNQNIKSTIKYYLSDNDSSTTTMSVFNSMHESNDYNLKTLCISTKNRHHYAKHSCAAQVPNIKKNLLSHAFQ